MEFAGYGNDLSLWPASPTRKIFWHISIEKHLPQFNKTENEFSIPKI